MKFYIILGNNKDTQSLIDHLREKDDGPITIIDEDMRSGLSQRGGLTYAATDFVEAVKDMDINHVYYHYIQPMHRKDGRAWRRVNAR
ncbi:hypothetical protein [Sporosarcina sp. YIM B06819]|uniref:hypothetical protein n=1 Tax=Sporosarcina sp. YIM B06819 TaxID=3081769 RepID=UPI00298C43FF|nr:hypothetical protein [Sporosarcina sp. YIM B06819]